MYFVRIRFAIFASLLFFSIGTQAQAKKSVAISSQLSLREAIAATLSQNPQFHSFQFRREALAGDMQTASLKPALRVESSIENFAGSGDYKSMDTAEFTLALSSVIELGDKRNARLGVVSERQQQLAVEQQILELDLLAEVTRRFIEVATAQQQLELQRASVKIAKETTRDIKRRVDMGNTPEAELARAQAHQARMNLSLYQAQVAFDAAKIQLSALWASTEPEFTSVSANLINPGELVSLEQLLNGLANNPDIQFFASDARLKDAELRLALSQRHPDLEWSAGLRRLQASKDSAVVVGVSVPLFSGNRVAGDIASAKANRQLVDNERELAMLKCRAQLIALYREQQAALYEVNSMRTDVIPQLQKALTETRAAFDKGRYGYLELSAAQQDLLNAESALIQAAANTHLLRAEIERLSGTGTTKNYEVIP